MAQVNKAHKCDSCGQTVATYRRVLNTRLVSALSFFHEHNGRWLSSKEIDEQFRPLSWEWLRFWGFIQKNPERRGEWCIAERGLLFVTGGLAPVWVDVYNNEVVNYAGEKVTIEQARQLTPRRNPRRSDEYAQEACA